LLPALNKVRQQAKLVACASNMRQIGVALASYTSRYGCYPPGGPAIFSGADYGNYCWSSLLLPDLGHPEEEAGSRHAALIFKCPSDVNEVPYTPTIVTSWYGQRSYVANLSAMDLVNADIDADGHMGGRRVSDIRHPSEKIVVAEAHHPRNWVGYTLYGLYCYQYGNYWGYRTPNGLANASDPGVVFPFGQEHQGSANYLFADGHVATIRYADMQQWVGQTPPANTDVQNPWVVNR
jgi:prepilin-type processing-associated H-X9-DG protein